jgi:hypothetical protein
MPVETLLPTTQHQSNEQALPPGQPATQLLDIVKRTLPEVLESKIGVAETLTFLHDRANNEQSFFWSRFSAGLAMAGAAFALVTTDLIQYKGAFAIASLIVAVLWFVIQWRSLQYVDSSKARYNEFLAHLGVTHETERPLLNSTRAALCVTCLNLCVWIAWSAIVLMQR